jgi:hypothetical protein
MGLFGRWRQVDDDRLTPEPVPFELPLHRLNATDGGFVERAEASVALLDLLIFFFGFLALANAAAAVFGGYTGGLAWDHVLLAAFGAAFMFWVVWLMQRARRKAIDRTRELVIHGTPATATLRGGGARAAETSSPLASCQLRIHPVRLAILHTRRGRPIVHWDGFAAVVHLGAARFVIACQKTREQLQACIDRLPVALGAIQSGDGPLIEADAHKRVF